MKKWFVLGAIVGELVLLGLAFYLGIVWEAHHRDAAVIKATNTQLTATQNALDSTQAQWSQAAERFRQDSAALDAIAQEYLHAHTQRTSYFRTLQGRMRDALAARDGTHDCAIGARGLRLWNDANRGAPAAAGAAAAAAGDRPEPAPAVSAAAAGRERPVAGTGAKPPARGRAVPRLRGSAGPAAARGAPARDDRGAAHPFGASGARAALTGAP